MNETLLENRMRSFFEPRDFLYPAVKRGQSLFHIKFPLKVQLFNFQGHIPDYSVSELDTCAAPLVTCHQSGIMKTANLIRQEKYKSSNKSTKVTFVFAPVYFQEP